MSEQNTGWKVLEHGPLEKLSDRVWRVQGRLPGMSLERVMTVVRRQSGGLLIHSAIALREAEMRELEAWGTPELLLVPNGYHRLDAPAFKRRYPALKVYAPAVHKAKVEQVIAVDATYEELAADDVVQVLMLPGTAGREGALLVRDAAGVTVVFNDVVMNMDVRRDFLGRFFTTLLGSAPGPRVSRLAKFALVKDKGALRRELERLAALPDLARVIVSHDKLAATPEQARHTLKQAATYLA